MTLWTAARQAYLSIGFSRQGHWSGLPFPLPEDLPDPGIKLKSPALQADSLPLRHEGFPWIACSSSELIWRYMAVTRRQLDFPGGSDGKASVYNVGDLGSSPGLGRSPGEGNGNPLRYYWKSHGQRSLVGYSLWGRKESDTTEWLHFHFHYLIVAEHKVI